MFISEQGYIAEALHARQSDKSDSFILNEDQMFIMALFHERIKNKPLDEFTSKLMVRYCPNFVCKFTPRDSELFKKFINNDRHRISDLIGRYLYKSEAKTRRWTSEEIYDILRWHAEYAKTGRKWGSTSFVYKMFTLKYPQHKVTKNALAQAIFHAKKRQPY